MKKEKRPEEAARVGSIVKFDKSMCTKREWKRYYRKIFKGKRFMIFAHSFILDEVILINPKSSKMIFGFHWKYFKETKNKSYGI